jgi:DNA modification methylase
LIIETIPISKIKAAPYNPRKDLKPSDPEYLKLAKSLKEFDLVEPLIWNKRSGNLVGGHQRLKVLKDIGQTEVEVSVVDLSDTKEKALNIALNKISGEWDLPLLKDLLQEIDTGDFDIEVTGFDSKEIEDLVNQLHQPEEGLTDDDAIPENVETVCKKGDLWKLGEHRLLCGDATVITDVEKLMQGEKADMVFTDPPYGMNLDTDYTKLRPDTEASRRFQKAKGKTTNKNYSPVIGDEKEWDFNNVLPIDCNEQFWFGADWYRRTLPKGGSFIVWDKRTNDDGSNLDEMFGSCFELCWSKQRHKREIARIKYASLFGTEREDVKKRLHPTQKPVLLCQWFLDKFSKQDNTVIDIFGGSGSTLIACEKLDRKCRMMEIDEHYCDVIIKRFEDFTGQKAELIL